MGDHLVDEGEFVGCVDEAEGADDVVEVEDYEVGAEADEDDGDDEGVEGEDCVN